MPFGQSVAVRFGAKAIAAALGADTATQTAIARAAGWAVAALTADFHSQAVIDADDEYLTQLYKSDQQKQAIESAANEILHNRSVLAKEAYDFSIKDLEIWEQERYSNEKFRENFIHTLEELLSLIIYFIISELREPDDYFQSYLKTIKPDYESSEDIALYHKAIDFMKESVIMKLSTFKQLPAGLAINAVSSLSLVTYLTR